MSETTKSHDAEDILSEFRQIQNPEKSDPSTSKSAGILDDTSDKSVMKNHGTVMQFPHKERDVIFIGTKPIMAYVSALLTQLAIQPTVTIKARGKRITQAVDVSQMIVKRMDTVGYIISDVRISSDSLKSQDGKQRNVSNIEIDITKT